MPNLLAEGARRLAELREETASDLYTYRRGGREVSIRATLGRAEFEVETSAGVQTIEQVDFITRPQWLAELFPPVNGDQVEGIDPRDGQRRRWQVMLPDRSAPVWRWCDQYRQSLRIHCKQHDSDAP